MTAVMRLAEAVLQAGLYRSAHLHQIHWIGLIARNKHTRDHDEQFHQVIIDGWRRRRLDDKDILVSDGRVDLDRGLEREELGHGARSEGDAQSEESNISIARLEVVPVSKRTQGPRNVRGNVRKAVCDHEKMRKGVTERQEVVERGQAKTETPRKHDSPSSNSFCELGMGIAYAAIMSSAPSASLLYRPLSRGS